MEAHISTEPSYIQLAKDEGGLVYSEIEDEDKMFPRASHHNRCQFVQILVIFLSVGAGFLAGAVWMRNVRNIHSINQSPQTAPRIPIPDTQREFIYSSPFSLEPPKGKGSGEEPEPIWDALVPNGLGFFKDNDLAPKVSIPTTFHQLHCLYILRRAYYSTTTSDKMQSFDLGKNRTIHAAHCFDYLKQTITCSVDTTVEPYENGGSTDGFLGSGFPRQCRSFEVLKQYVEKWRVFNATGFLADGITHGRVHVHENT